MREPIYQYGDTGVFDVSLTATYNGCDTTHIKEEYITIYPPLANFTADVICEGNRLDVSFDDISLGADSTVWVSPMEMFWSIRTALYTLSRIPATTTLNCMLTTLSQVVLIRRIKI